MLFLQFLQYSSSFVDTPKNEIPGAALELCQLKIKQFPPEILKLSTKHEDNPVTLNCYMVPHTFLFIFQTGSRRLGSNNFWNSSYKKTAGSARVSRLSFRFLWLWYIWLIYVHACSHPHILRFLCVCLYPRILIFLCLCVLACILASLHPRIFRWCEA